MEKTMNDLTRPFSLDTYLADLAPLINLDCGTRTPAGVRVPQSRLMSGARSAR
ncbi:hypothetical protein KAM476_42430 [Aeromonas caviae]|nr:hypothetical protein KAM476_42430 [Aeromonas caviae]